MIFPGPYLVNNFLFRAGNPDNFDFTQVYLGFSSSYSHTPLSTLRYKQDTFNKPRPYSQL